MPVHGDAGVLFEYVAGINPNCKNNRSLALSTLDQHSSSIERTPDLFEDSTFLFSALLSFFCSLVLPTHSFKFQLRGASVRLKLYCKERTSCITCDGNEIMTDSCRDS